jgi:DNA-binding NarL/FixJ family response regulator
MLTVVRAAWPLRGRDGETVELVSLLRRRRGALLAGPSGVGKTSIAVAVAEEMEPAGWTVVRVVASRPTAGIPLGALAVLLATTGSLDEVVAASARVRARIVATAAGRPAMLVVDDAQWLDEASAVVLHQLVAQGDATLLATLRTGEPAPDPVTALWKDGLVERIEVAPLGDEAVRDVLEAALDGPVETLTASRLWRRCGGNVLYLRELVREAERLGLLQCREGLWCIDTLPPGSPRLAELVAERLGALDEPARAGLEVIAVGEPVRLGMLDELVDRDTLERLESAGLIVVGGSGDDVVVRPAHPLFGDVVRSSLPEIRRRRLMRALADLLEHRGAASRDDIIRLALWRLDGGGAATPRLLLGAARQAHFAFDGTTAERLARAAWAADRGFEAARVLADVLFARGGFVEREELLATVAVTAATDERRALVAASRAVGLFWGLLDAGAAEDVLVAAEGEVNDPAWWSEVRATRATLVGQTGRHRDVLGLLADLPDDPGGRAGLQAALAEAFALPGVGRGEDAVARIDAALSAAAELGPQPTLFTAGLLLSPKAMALAGLGRLDEAAAVAHSGLTAAVETGNRAAEAFFGSTLGWVQLNQGLLVSAQRTYRESAAAFRSISYGGPLRWALGGLLFAAALARDREVVGVAARALDALDPHPAALFDTTISRARAWAAVVEGDPEWGRRLLGEAAGDARSRGAVVEEGTVLHDLARLGRADEVADRLYSLAAAAQGDLVRILADSAAGLARGSPDALGDVAERFAALGFNMRAAESAMAASEASARAHDQRGATRWARRATELAALCEAAAPVVELVGAAGPVPLTNREREIALLAADGLASRVIAERLFVSVRTVENHLGRIYTKLGVASRAELADLVRR